jgi:hypothetical protein
MFLSMFALMPVYYGIIMWLCIQIFEYILYVRTLMKILVARHNVLTVEKNTRVPSHFYLVFQLFIIKNVHSFYTCNIRGTTHFYLRFQLFFIKNVPSRYICKTGQLNECMLLLLWRQLLPQMEYMAEYMDANFTPEVKIMLAVISEDLF